MRKGNCSQDLLDYPRLGPVAQVFWLDIDIDHHHAQLVVHTHTHRHRHMVILHMLCVWWVSACITVIMCDNMGMFGPYCVTHVSHNSLIITTIRHITQHITRHITRHITFHIAQHITKHIVLPSTVSNISMIDVFGAVSQNISKTRPAHT